MTVLIDNRPSTKRKAQLDDSTKVLLAQRVSSMQDRGQSTKSMVKALAGEYMVGASTVYKWVKEYRYGTLTKPSTTSPVITEEILKIFYSHHGVFLATHRELVKLGLWTFGESALRKAVHAEVNHILVKAAKLDEQAWRQLFAYVRYETPHRNDEWQIDTKFLPLMVEASNGDLVKPTATIVLDGRTRMVMGYAIHLGAPNSESTIAALVSAMTVRYRTFQLDDGSEVEIMVGGAPMQLLCDNATEFLSGHQSAALADWGVVSMPVAEYQPNLKGKIERFNRDVDDWATQFVPWTAGPKDLRGGEPYRNAGKEVLMTSEELLTLFSSFIDEHNFERGHRSLGGKTPFEEWAGLALADLEAANQGLRTIDEASLTRHALTPIGTRVVKKGEVQYANNFYLDPALADVPRGRVEVRVLRGDDTFVECWDGDEFVCRAWNRRGLTDGEINAILERRFDMQHQIRRLRRAGAGHAATRQVERISSTHQTTPSTEVSLPTSTAVEVSAEAEKVVASLDDAFRGQS